MTICGECKNKISDKAKSCPFCGCPIEINHNEQIICKINGIEYDFTGFYNRIMTVKRNNGLYGDPDFVAVTKEIRELTGITATFKLCNLIAQKEEVPDEYNDNRTTNVVNQERQIIESSKIHCPNCNSTNVKQISGTERAASVLGLGILSKKINKSYKCLNCKYTW